jgi:histidinol dehydrogenase
MKTIRFKTPAWDHFLASLPRSAVRRPAIERTVRTILRDVERNGDSALVRLTARFDGVRLAPARLRVPAREIETLARRAEPRLADALRAMAERIEVFHRRQRERGFRLRLADGSTLEERVLPLESVGLYVPGGAGAYPSSVLMNAIPARVARVPRIVVVTPPRALEQNPAVATALVIVGLQGSVYRVGGAQAIAALAYGTASLPSVVKIVGPGNAYVAEAKRQVRGRVEIDQEAGPSEVVILADETADAGFVAADLLAQAEHGSGDEAAVLVTPSPSLAAEVARLVADGLRVAANPAATKRALERNAAIVLVRDLAAGLEAVNKLAAEHLEIIARGAGTLARQAVAGAVFIGPDSPVAVGDYGIGPSHVLPTGGSARFSSPLSVRDFVRRQSAVRLSRRGLRRVAEGMICVAEAEGFTAHAQSVATRLVD